MSVISTPAMAGDAVSTLAHPLLRLSVDQYHQMIQAGILAEDHPVELLEGLLVPKMNKSPRHRAVSRLTRLALERLVPDGWYVDAQEPISLQDSEPEPDISVTRADTGKLLDRHPGPVEVGLVVEVSDSTLATDRSTKRRVYARAGVPVYWIVNLVRDRIEVYSHPARPADAPEYHRRQDYAPGEELPLILDNREVGVIPVRELLPRG